MSAPVMPKHTVVVTYVQDYQVEYSCDDSRSSISGAQDVGRSHCGNGVLTNLNDPVQAKSDRLLLTNLPPVITAYLPHIVPINLLSEAA